LVGGVGGGSEYDYGHSLGYGYGLGYGHGYGHGYWYGYGHGHGYDYGDGHGSGCPSTPAFWDVSAVPASPEQRGHAVGCRIVGDHATRASGGLHLNLKSRTASRFPWSAR